MNEFDPDWDPIGVQAFSFRTGIPGRAPILFIDDPSIDREPPQPGTSSERPARTTASGASSTTRRRTRSPRRLHQVVSKTSRPSCRRCGRTWSTPSRTGSERFDLDGFRIDTVKHVEHGFWQAFTAGVHARLGPKGKTNFLLFGEAFDGNDQLLGSYTVPGMLDSVFYFPQHYSGVPPRLRERDVPAQQKGTSRIAEPLGGARAELRTSAQPGGRRD